jgi:eukaryotic-like serine/threonine-protein kinase
MVGELIANRYELERVLGTGGMATVFCAFDTVLERKVALKVLHEHYAADGEYVARFENEARAAARLAHPNIVTVMDRGEQDGRRYIVFEYVDGENLKDAVVAEGPLPIERVLRVGADVARGLAFAHTSGVVHRDVKPQNVLLDEDGRAKVTDFGIARTGTATGHTETGTILGTGSYISPEQARGERAGPESDVYSLGAVLYELLAGRPPYDGPTFVAVALRHVREPVPDVLAGRPDCPPALAALVEACLAKDPSERPTADALARGLSALGRGDAVPEADDRTLVISRRPQPRKRRLRRVSLIAALALLVGVAVAAAVALWPGDEAGGSSGGAAVAVEAVATNDPPPGDGTENDGSVPEATDGDETTSWSTEGYDDFASFGKEGVGLVVDAGADRALSSLTVTTDLPGWTAEIRAGDSTTSFPQSVGESRTAGARTTWELEGEPARYYLIWITAMASDSDGKDRAHVNEVTARA